MAASHDSQFSPGNVAALKDLVFRSYKPEKEGMVLAPTLREHHLIVTLPDSAFENEEITRKSVKAFFHYLMEAGTATGGTGQQWRTFVLTAIATAFVGLKKLLLEDSGGLYREAPITPEVMTRIRKWSVAAIKHEKEEDEKARAVLAEAVKTDAVDIKELPPLPAQLHPVGQSLEQAGIYGYFSLILFLAGKTITEVNRAAIVEKRPKAIEGKYFSSAAVPCLSGALRLSNRAHSEVHSAFTAMSHMRELVFTEVAKFSVTKNNYEVEVVATTTRLMAYAGMQHVIMINKFLDANEVAFKIPMLQPALRSYVLSLKHLQTEKEVVRPFFKLIHGDTTRAFNRKDVEPLLVVAVMEELKTNDTLSNFALPGNVEIIQARYAESLREFGPK